MTRADLPPGSQAVQSAHAALTFVAAHPGQQWHTLPLVVLAAPDELSLVGLGADAAARALRFARFFEPDLGHQLTAVALEPAGYRLVSRLPLALSGGGDIMAPSIEDLRAQLVELTAERDALRAAQGLASGERA